MIPVAGGGVWYTAELPGRHLQREHRSEAAEKAKLDQAEKEHIANIEQTWYKIAKAIESKTCHRPVCPARESPP
jgi:hypothetical protein